MNAFVHDARTMTPQRRARLFLQLGPNCAKCTVKIRPGMDWDLDHILALENGGSDTDENLQVLCGACHDLKTPDDHALAGHGRRMATKHVVPGRHKKSKWRR